MEAWLRYIEEMVTIGHMEAAAIIYYDSSMWVCSERAFKLNQKEYDVLCRLLDKRAPHYKVKFKRNQYFVIDNNGEILVMESLNPRGQILVLVARTLTYMIAIKVSNDVGLEAAKIEMEWVKNAISDQDTAW